MFHQHSSACNHNFLASGLDEAQSHKTQILWLALVLLSSFSIAELVVSFQSHSLSLLADAGHMLSDSLALIVALLATWIARLPASPQAPFGYRRVEILAALANGLGLIAIALWIVWESTTRLQAPPNEILSLPMLITACVGLVVSSTNAWLLHRGSHNDLNLRGAFLHMLADAVSSMGVILAAIAVHFWHWFWMDGVISLFVALLIAIGSVPLVMQSLNILLEKPPAHLDLNQLESYLLNYPEVMAVKTLKVWTVALGQELLCAHLVVNLYDGKRRDRLVSKIQFSLQREFGIAEVIVQMTSVPLPWVEINNPLSDSLSRLIGSEPFPESMPPSSR